MKYIRERNGKREIVEKKKHSRVYVIQAVLKWTFCLSILFLTVVVCGFFDQKLNEGRIVNKILNIATEVAKVESAEILETTEAPVAEEGLRVCLDPGHGGIDPGCDSDGRIESEDNWRLAQAIKAEMESQGIEVVMTREDNDTKVFLAERVAIANDSGADYFISIHRNKGDGYGNETWMFADAGEVTKALTGNIHEAFNEVGVQRDRGIKTSADVNEGSDYYVITNTNMPACLLEIGFINNVEDNRLFDANLENYAKAVTQAVQDTYNQFGETTDVPIMDGTETEEGTETTENAISGGILLNNPAIDNVSALDGEILNWGQGSNVDQQNRPTGSLSYQEKFRDYPVDFIIPTSEKKIYLTFDEGYEYGCTPSILSTLKEKGVNAVFFVTQPYAKEDPELIRQMIDEGHMIGNHTVSHPASGVPSLSLEEQKQEVMGNHEYIKQNFGYDMCLFRFPAGKFSEQSLAVLNNCGYRSVFWSFAYLDYDVNNQPNEAESLQKMIDKLHPGAIYLLHAESWTNTNVLGDFIDKAREAGYEFASYADLLQ